MNIRYRVQNCDTGEIRELIVPLAQLEVDGLNGCGLDCRHRVLSRDLGTGRLDKNGVEVFKNDRVFNPDCNGIHTVMWMDITEGTGFGIDCSSPMRWELMEVVGRSDEEGK
jgi:hypothetical protein